MWWWMDYFIILFRTIFFYILISLIFRFMGKREIGQLGMTDLIVYILIAEFAAVSIEQKDEPLLLFVLPVILLVIIQIIVSYISLKWGKVRDVFDGKQSIIIDHGKINFNVMASQRYNIEDLLTQLRENGVRCIEEVDFAILETSGNLSVFKKDSNYLGDYPLPVILDGKIDYDVLKRINKSEKWIKRAIEDDISNIFYAFYHDKKLFIIRNDDLIK